MHHTVIDEDKPKEVYSGISYWLFAFPLLCYEAFLHTFKSKVSFSPTEDTPETSGLESNSCESLCNRCYINYLSLYIYTHVYIMKYIHSSQSGDMLLLL